VNIRQLDSTSADFDQQLQVLLSSNDEPDEEFVSAVQSILTNVRQRGDKALLEYTNQFDQRNTTIDKLEIPLATCTRALSQIPKELRVALEASVESIQQYHEHQKQESWMYEDKEGNHLGQQVTAIDRVGVYVPGGKAAYPSSVLMNVIPATVAEVGEIIMVVPAPKDELNPLVLAAASIAGVDRIFTVGGAQAIAALAFGTDTIPRVDKIVGPGNRYVAMAKRMVFGSVGIDMIAGPSEVVVVCDGKSNPDWIAMDMFAQAEHDEEACSILITPDYAFIEAVSKSIAQLLPDMERADIIRTALENKGALIHVPDIKMAINLVNHIAPEHLELSVSEPGKLLPIIRNAGAIFMGRYSAEVLGDYCAGPNHVLPTSRTARFSSPLGVYDFQKRTSLIQCTAQSVSTLAETASVLARGEGLTAHARSAEYRISNNKR